MGKERVAMREAMSKVDTAWLRMERPTNLMMITGLLMLRSKVDIAAFRRMIKTRFLAYRRFAQKAVDDGTSAHWMYYPEFDLKQHVVPIKLRGKKDKAALQELVSALASTPLDKAHPLWQFHIVEDYLGGSAVIARIHHCYADGVALIQVLLSLTDAQIAPQKTQALTRVWLKGEKKGVLDRLLAPAAAGVKQAVALGETALSKGLQIIAEPAQIPALFREGAEILRELAVALSLSDDPQTSLKGELSTRKSVAWAEPLKLEEVKAVSKALGCTVNDVLMAAAAGALRSYFLAQGEAVDGLTIRATVPVNLRPLEHAKQLGNHFGLVFLDLPIGEPNPLRCLELVAENMRELKRSRQAIVAFGLLAALGMGPSVIQQPALDLFSRKASAVATNVPGPQKPLFIAGSQIDDLMFWVPQTGGIGLGISILSYDGAVHFGLIADSNRIADPNQVIKHFSAEFEKLLLITLMEDWAEEISSHGAAQTLASCLSTVVKTAREGVQSLLEWVGVADEAATEGNKKLPKRTKTTSQKAPKKRKSSAKTGVH